MALIIGNNLRNRLNGTADDDILIGLGGNDSINGGAGIDTAWFSGNVGGYHFSYIDGELMVRDSAPLVSGMDGTDTLKNIEKLQFSNAQFTLSPFEFQVNSFTTGNQLRPSMAALVDGGWVVSWTSNGQDGSADGIYAQRYNAAGAAQGVEFQVNSFTSGDQLESSIAALADGGWVVSWTSARQDGSADGVYAQRYNAAGAAQGVEFQVNTFTTGRQFETSIAALADGGWVVSWTSNPLGLAALSVHAQRYNAAGATEGVEFQVNTTLDNQLLPSMAALANGGFIVVWTSFDQDGSDHGVNAQRYDAAGGKQGLEFQVNSFTTGDQFRPNIAALVDGGWVVSWSSSGGQDGSDFGIYAQRYNAAGARQGVEFQVNSFTSGDQLESSIAALADGGWVVSWTSLGQDGSGDGVYAQRYDAAGNAVVGLKLTGSAAADIIRLDPGQLMAVDGAAGNDTIIGSRADDLLFGGADNDTLRGNAGNDYLDGGVGVDIVAGGIGDDVYVIDSALDVVREAEGAGNDTINSSITKKLGANFENLTLTGVANINGTGNTASNIINGNSGNNILDGLAGEDVMSGGAGNDTYMVDNTFDNVEELVGNGTDLVNSSVSYALAGNIENLTLTGLASIVGLGNELANTLIGNAAGNTLLGGNGSDTLIGHAGSDFLLADNGAENGNDTLAGGLGNDVLFGGLGLDTFVFNTELSAANNFDNISRYNAADDTIHLSKLIFTALGLANTTITAAEFRTGAGINTAGDASDRIIYNSTSGDLLYDRDGTGAAAAIKFAVLTTTDLIGLPTITEADFFVIA